MIGEASKILGVHPQTLRKWDKEGRLKALRFGVERRYVKEELEELIITK